MDTRIKQQIATPNESQIHQELSDQILSDDDEILKIDHAKNNEKYLDATIYNLCMKLKTQQQLEDLYFQAKERDPKALIPKSMQNYIHHPFFIPMTILPITYMKFKKTLTLNRAVLTVCFITTLNEHYKYRKCMEADEKICQEYQQHTQSYRELFINLQRTLTWKDVFQYAFSVDFDKQTFGSQSHYNIPLVDDFNFNLY